MESVINQHIEITPGVCGGKPRIAGSRIRVQDVVIWHEKMGLSPDEIVSQCSNITLADVYAALAYYHDNLEQIRQQIKEGEATVRELQAKTPSKLQDYEAIKELIFQLPVEEQIKIMEELEARLKTVSIMKLAETGFPEWNDPEEDIYSV